MLDCRRNCKAGSYKSQGPFCDLDRPITFGKTKQIVWYQSEDLNDQDPHVQHFSNLIYPICSQFLSYLFSFKILRKLGA